MTIRQKAQVEDTIMDRIQSRQLIWYGHVNIIDKNNRRGLKNRKNGI